MKNVHPILLMAMMMAEQGLPIPKEVKELTPEDQARIEAKRQQYELEKTKGDRNLSAVEEARKRNGLPPLQYGKKDSEK